MKPNGTTDFALAHPMLWTLGSTFAVGLIGFLVFQDWRPAAVGFVGLALVNAVLWNPRGPGRRWAERARDARP